MNLAAAEIGRMIIKKMIEPITTKWAAPIVLATRKHGSIPFCLDCRKLNAVSIGVRAPALHGKVYRQRGRDDSVLIVGR